MATRPVPTLESGIPVMPSPVVPASGNRATAGLLAHSSGTLDDLNAHAADYLLRRQAEDELHARDRDVSASTRVALERFRQLETSADLSDPAVVQGYAEFLDNLYGETVATHAGGDASRARLQSQLGQHRDKLLDQLSIESVTVRRRKIQDRFGERVNGLAAQAHDDPTSVAGTLTDLDDVLDDMAPAFPPDQLDQARRFGQSEILKSGVTGLIARGAYDLAEEVMVTRPELAEVLDPAEYRALRGRIMEARQTENSLERAVAEREAILGRPLREPELMAVLSLPASGGGEAKLSDLSTFRGQFAGLSQPFIQTRDSYARVRAAAENPSPAGDLSLIFGYMKMIDPGSVVREGEFATAQNAAGVDGRLRALYNQLINGERLTEKQRADFAGQAHNLFAAQLEQQQALAGEYGRMAAGSGIDPALAVPDFIGAAGGWQPIGGAQAATDQPQSAPATLSGPTVTGAIPQEPTHLVLDQAAYDALPVGARYRTVEGGEVYTKRAR